MIREITQEIATRTGFTLGTNLYFGVRPQTAPDRCVLVAFNGGGSSFFDLPDRRDQMVQVLARSKDYTQAYDDSVAVWNAIQGLSGISLPEIVTGEEWEAMTIEAVNPPQYIGPDDQGRHEFSTNYIWRVKDASK